MSSRTTNSLLSPCCGATIDASRGDGVWIGSCSKCGRSVVRINPWTGVQEWLDGFSPWCTGALRPVELPARECPSCRHQREHGWTEGECLCAELEGAEA